MKEAQCYKVTGVGGTAPKKQLRLLEDSHFSAEENASVPATTNSFPMNDQDSSVLEESSDEAASLEELQ